MSTADKLTTSLQSILNGHPWYGPNTYDILEGIPFETAYEKPQGAVHSIAGILLHMLGWTMEATQRIQGQTAGEPAGGDWPDPGQPDEEKWQHLISSFKLANVTLMDVIANLPAEQWQQPTRDERNRELGTGVTHEALIEGLIQHHIYHSGQLAMRKRSPQS